MTRLAILCWWLFLGLVSCIFALAIADRLPWPLLPPERYAIACALCLAIFNGLDRLVRR